MVFTDDVMPQVIHICIVSEKKRLYHLINTNMNYIISKETGWRRDEIDMTCQEDIQS